jgi:hypothetical protein
MSAFGGKADIAFQGRHASLARKGLIMKKSIATALLSFNGRLY